MNKDDWTVLLIRLLGLYLVAMHITGLVVSSVSIWISLHQTMDTRQFSSNFGWWQGPVMALTAVIIGVVLIIKATRISKLLQSLDR